MNPDFQGVPLDRTTISQDRLNIENKLRTNPFPWSGQFSPQLIETLLKTYAPAGGFIVDPFVGSGTVLYEAGRLGHRAFGSEVNPAAFKMAEIYRFINVHQDERLSVIDEADKVVHDALPAPSLFSIGKKTGSLQEALTDAAAVAESALVRTLLDGLVVLLNFGLKPLEAAEVLRTWSKLLNTVIALPFTDVQVDVANCDARTLPLASVSVDFIVTSPPYINVFNYHQHYRRSVESLGFDLLKVARSEIGSNRKHRQNRFLTVIQYCLDMAAVLQELRRVCRPQARIIVVLGRESRVRKTPFYNGEIVARLAVMSCGCILETRQERVFQNRFGELIYEDILHFTFGNESFTPPADIAVQTLADARNRVPDESITDLNDALERIAEIRPSPLFSAPAAIESHRLTKQNV